MTMTCLINLGPFCNRINLYNVNIVFKVKILKLESESSFAEGLKETTSVVTKGAAPPMFTSLVLQHVGDICTEVLSFKLRDSQPPQSTALPRSAVSASFDVKGLYE